MFEKQFAADKERFNLEDTRETERTNLKTDRIKREDKREKSQDRKDNQQHADQLEWELEKFNCEKKLVTDRETKADQLQGEKNKMVMELLCEGKSTAEVETIINMIYG
ncbi:hypothetical protein PtA15_5A848 [Puccinia triticina]|uniref:Uncharacterized protein n=1 Tax=Puccinia triticina TaxID=208348 RepID=A0ABY7CLR4_9BASI|nr:uncharacterized protein PtA15_5A848 [Puccinia triticina]WAQ85273.1 hypothetical protein PtA15_5A848 [Puccinia triticina]